MLSLLLLTWIKIDFPWNFPIFNFRFLDSQHWIVNTIKCQHVYYYCHEKRGNSSQPRRSIVAEEFSQWYMFNAPLCNAYAYIEILFRKCLLRRIFIFCLKSHIKPWRMESTRWACNELTRLEFEWFVSFEFNVKCKCVYVSVRHWKRQREMIKIYTKCVVFCHRSHILIPSPSLLSTWIIRRLT